MKQSSGPLNGIKVVEISVAMAGPYCGMLLGDYGADVIKIERPDGGDDSRSWPPFFFDELGYYYASANRNKRGIALDLKSAEGVRVAEKLIAQADILIHNFRPGVLERLGLGWEELSKRHPRLIYCAISGFGAQGPLAGEPANDLFMQAYSGGMGITGEPGGSPAKMGLSIADIGAGMFGAIGILMALQSREKTGLGQRVDTSLLEGQVSMLAHFITRYFASGDVPGPSGSGALGSPIYRAFRASDEWLVVAAFNQRMWRSLAQVIGHPEWCDDPRFQNAEQRSAHKDELIALLSPIFATRPQQFWLTALRDAEVPCSPVNRIDQVVELEQVHACEMIQSLDIGAGKTVSMAGLPIKFSATPGRLDYAPPRLGEHTQAILVELGYAEADIQRLLEAEVISAGAPSASNS